VMERKWRVSGEPRKGESSPVVRGGSWDYAAPMERVAMRNDNSSSAGLYSLGIRLVKSNP